jgi:hypothetical protein
MVHRLFFETSTTTVCLLTLSVLAGCASGAMGQVSTETGAGTDKGALLSSLDAPLAVGGDVRPALHTDIKGSSGPPLHFVSARPDVVEVRDGLLVGKSPGMSAVLVAIGSNTVVDFIHVWVAAVDRIDVHRVDGGGTDNGPLTEPIDLVTGEEMRLVPHAYAGSSPLVGVATSTWSVEPPIALVLREGLPNRVRLVATAPGTADLKVTMLGTSSHIKLTVVR